MRQDENIKCFSLKHVSFHLEKSAPGIKKNNNNNNKKGWSYLFDAVHLDSINCSLYWSAILLNQELSDTFHFEPYLFYIKLRIVLGCTMSSSNDGFLKTSSPKPIFLKEKNLPYRAVLILNNAPSYPNEEELISSGICALFLPPIVTSLLQSMFEEKI